MPPVFVDTGGWLALLRRDDRMHERARRFYGRLVADGARLLTTNYVVDETATRLRYDAGLPAALAFHAALDRSTAGGSLRIAWIDPKLEREGWDLFERHADVTLSLTDAVSAVVAGRAKIRQVFGFDADFRALGFDVQPST